MRVVAFVADLMDRSRIAAALPATSFAADAGAAEGADVAVVDLSRFGDLVAAVRVAAPHARIVAFGPHVDPGALSEARAAGADAAVTRSQFFRDPAAAVAPDGVTPG